MPERCNGSNFEKRTRTFPAIKSDKIRRLSPKEVCGLDTLLWNWFYETGEPLAYVLYRRAEEETS